MKRFSLIATLSTLLLSTPLRADEAPAAAPAAEEAPVADEAPAIPAQAPMSDNPGVAAATATDTAKSSSWQNWVFAGGAMVAAIIAVVIVSVSEGSSAH